MSSAGGVIPPIWTGILQSTVLPLKSSPETAKSSKPGRVDFYTFSYYMSSCQSADPAHPKGEGNIVGGVPNPYLKASEWG